MASDSVSKELIKATREFRDEIVPLRFATPVAYVYNPLDYAWLPYEAYLTRYAAGSRGRTREAIFLGMNPGPFGMAQTGVPFGEVASVRDWLKIEAPVGKPADEHPKRPIEGFSCARSEVSGRRLWGAIAEHFGTPDRFFDRFFVANYCPLVFMEESGRNMTPDKLAPQEKKRLFQACDRHLQRMVELLKPRWVIGIGGFAQKRAEEALSGRTVRIGCILHPSPASPLANRDWAGQAKKQLQALGLCVK